MPPKRPDGRPPRPPQKSPERKRGGNFVDTSVAGTSEQLQGVIAVRRGSQELARAGFPRKPPVRMTPRPDSPFHRDNWKPSTKDTPLKTPREGDSLTKKNSRELQKRLRDRRYSKEGDELSRFLSGSLEPYEPFEHPTARKVRLRREAKDAADAPADSDSDIEPEAEPEYDTKPSDPSVVYAGLPNEDEPVDPTPEPPPEDFDSAPLVYRPNIVPHLRGLPGVVTKPNIDSYFGDSYGPLPSTGFNRAYDLIAQAKHGVTKTSPGMPFPFGASSHASSRRMYRRKPSLVAKDLQNRLDACEIKLSYLLDELSEHINDPELKSVERELGKIELETVGFIRGSGGGNGNDSDTLSESD